MFLMILIALVFGFVTTQIAGLATTIHLHRGLTHESFKLKRPTDWIFRIISWLMIGTVPREWVAVHRKHHAFTDVKGDPHSPVTEGFWKVQLGNVFYVIKEIKTIDLKHWARGVPDYGWFDRHYYLGLLVGLLMTTIVFGVIGELIGLGFFWGLLFGPVAGIFHALFYLTTVSTINGLCHVWGYKTFKDAEAYNIRFVALFTLGEGLHNNHHKYQRSPKLRTGERWFEFDFGWRVIQLLDLIGQIEKKSSDWLKS